MNSFALIFSRRVASPARVASLRVHSYPCLPTAHSSPCNLVHVRTVANAVSGRPGSQTSSHAATNVREEAGNTAADVAKTIAGGNYTSDAVRPESQTFLGITSALASSVPKPYMYFGLAGALPYLGTSATTVYLAKQAGTAAAGLSTGVDPGIAIAILHQALNLQVTYGAVMLSFLGALHWGMEFAGLGGHKGYRRLMLGAVPVLYAWPTLMLDPTMALVAQWVGFTGLWYADQKATSAGWTPKWYSQYRFYLSLLVGSCIIGSLAGTSYWGPVAGHGFAKHDLDRIRSERAKHTKQHESEGVVGGEIEAASGEAQNADSYVLIRRRKQEDKEEGGEEEGGNDAEQNDTKRG